MQQKFAHNAGKIARKNKKHLTDETGSKGGQIPGPLGAGSRFSYRCESGVEMLQVSTKMLPPGGSCQRIGSSEPIL